jgi:hypothetical protein
MASKKPRVYKSLRNAGRAINSGAEVADVIQLRGCIEMQLRNAKNGKAVGDRISLNTVVTAGRRWVLERIQSVSPPSTTITHLGVGTGTTAPATGDTALGSETVRIAIGTYTTTGLANNPPSWRAEATFATNEANTTLGEAGLFNSSSAGTMLSRVTYSTLNKTTSNTLSVSYTISN